MALDVLQECERQHIPCRVLHEVAIGPGRLISGIGTPNREMLESLSDELEAIKLTAADRGERTRAATVPAREYEPPTFFDERGISGESLRQAAHHGRLRRKCLNPRVKNPQSRRYLYHVGNAKTLWPDQLADSVISA
jgi:hypothetical protein